MVHRFGSSVLAASALLVAMLALALVLGGCGGDVADDENPAVDDAADQEPEPAEPSPADEAETPGGGETDGDTEGFQGRLLEPFPLPVPDNWDLATDAVFEDSGNRHTVFWVDATPSPEVVEAYRQELIEAGFEAEIDEDFGMVLGFRGEVDGRRAEGQLQFLPAGDTMQVVVTLVGWLQK